jgi:hypothetical protein
MRDGEREPRIPRSMPTPVPPPGRCQVCGAPHAAEEPILCRVCGEPVLLWGWAP